MKIAIKILLSRNIIIFCILILTQISSGRAQNDSNGRGPKMYIHVDEESTNDTVLVNGYAKLTLVKSKSREMDEGYVIKIQGVKPLVINESVYESSGKRMLAEYFSDDTELSEKILNGIFKFEDLEKIVADYNAWRRSIDRMTNEVK